MALQPAPIRQVQNTANLPTTKPHQLGMTLNENYPLLQMKINYFEDTDTALIEFTSERVAETREVSENIYLDLDESGNLVSMTIEHAGERANIRDFAFEHQPKVNV